MPKHPLAEVFGFPPNSFSPEAERYRKLRLCPFNNKVPSCTKDKAENPLGVCTIYEGDRLAITCPIRFREDWLIAEGAAAFFFPEGTAWTSLTEIRLNDKHGLSAGNIDVVLVAYNEQGNIIDFGALEVQAVYISGNIRKAFDFYMGDPAARADTDWTRQKNYPRPDYLSSSRKRLAPQLIYKGGILNAWRKKTAVALHRTFFETLPTLQEVPQQEAEVAWLVYELQQESVQNRYKLTRYKTVYTAFGTALDKITRSEPGPLEGFLEYLQTKLDEKREGGTPPDAPTLTDILDS
ncbi:MAG TPA: NotI family restriction endonuclease [Ktedonobacterales bacterium]|jgi:hypothetical protein